MKKNHSFCWMIMFLSVILIHFGNRSVHANPYGVEVFKTQNREEALQKQTAYINKGFGPVDVYIKDQSYRIIIGRYEDALTPKWIVERLKDSAVTGEMQSLEGITPLPEVMTSGTLANAIPSNIRYISFQKDPLLDSAFQEQRQEVVEFDRILKEQSVTDAEIYLQNILNTKPQDDPIQGWAMLKKGYLQYKKNDKSGMKDSFLAVADRRLTATRSHSCEALMRLGLALAGEKKKLESFQAFEELKNQILSANQKAFAQVQQAGIVMEVARGAAGGGGTLEDCRKSCLKVLEYVKPADFPSACATAELMYFETWFFDENWDKTVELGLAFLQKYPSQTRETAMCIHFLGIALEKTGNYKTAIEILQNTFEKDFTPKGTTFAVDGKSLDMKQLSANWIIFIARKYNDKETINRLADLYPAYFTHTD